MSEYTGSSWLYHRHCCPVPVHVKSLHRNAMVNSSSTCNGCFLVHPACGISPLLTTRCLCLSYCPFLPDAKYRAGKNLERSLDAGSPVLAKKETECYYYQGTIIKDIEEGETRSFLVQFAVGEDKTCVQKTARSDIFECVNGMRHSILPGDKVMAPWEPQQKRYGPGTVLQGMETRDFLREKEDEEITVSFWNGKKAKVPLGLALWIPPVRWERIVEKIHMPCTSGKKPFEGQLHRSGCYNGSCGTIPSCALGDFQRCQCACGSFICPRYSGFHHTCSLLRHRQYVSCCCCSKYRSCWLRPSLAEFTSGDLKKEFTSKPTTPFLPIEAPPKVEHATGLSSSSSSSSDSQCERENGVTKNTMIDHAVNTDFSFFENPALQEIRRPEWKYWKRSHPNSDYKSQGANIVSSSCRKERANNKAISSTDGSPSVLYNHSAIFETIEQSRQRHLSVKDVLNHRVTNSLWGG